jgi:hypothetical protein
MGSEGTINRPPAKKLELLAERLRAIDQELNVLVEADDVVLSKGPDLLDQELIDRRIDTLVMAQMRINEAIKDIDAAAAGEPPDTPPPRGWEPRWKRKEKSDWRDHPLYLYGVMPIVYVVATAGMALAVGAFVWVVKTLFFLVVGQ